MQGFSKNEIALLKRLNTPAKVQSFLNSIPFNFEKDNINVIKSPARVLRENTAHCIEGAVLGAYILSLHGYKPLVMHLKTTKNDYDHVIAPFEQGGLWGALSKTNHTVLRYREPVYRTIRELAMSYFHEYFTNDGKKNLRSYSVPINLNMFKDDWYMSGDNLFGIDDELDKAKHYEIAPKNILKNLRLADKIEISAGKIVEHKR